MSQKNIFSFLKPYNLQYYAETLYPFDAVNIQDVTIEDGDCSDLDKVDGPDSTHFEAEGLLIYYATKCEEK